MNDYTPVECGVHSEYELAIMHHATLQLSWIDQQNLTQCAMIEPLDLITRQGQEFLIFRTADNQSYEVRLDRIIHSRTL